MVVALHCVRALPTETKVESGTSESRSGTSVNSSNSVLQKLVDGPCCLQPVRGGEIENEGNRIETEERKRGNRRENDGEKLINERESASEVSSWVFRSKRGVRNHARPSEGYPMPGVSAIFTGFVKFGENSPRLPFFFSQNWLMMSVMP